jgi:cell wall-associated NlpC family hydrolase
MTVIKTVFRGTPRTRRRAGLVAAVTLGCALFVAPSVNAGSTPYTDSEAIAAEAVLAVDTFDTWNASGSSADFQRFERARDKVATMTAQEMGLSVSEVRRQFSSTTMEKQRIVLAAMSQLGVPYRSMQSREGEGFDCSGLTIWAFSDAGLEIPRSSGDQFRAADEQSAHEAEAGDLLYYPGHVGIYLGGDIYVHSRQTGRNVEVTMVPSRSHRFADIVPAEVIRLGGNVGEPPGAPATTQPPLSATLHAH